MSYEMCNQYPFQITTSKGYAVEQSTTSCLCKRGTTPLLKIGNKQQYTPIHIQEARYQLAVDPWHNKFMTLGLPMAPCPLHHKYKPLNHTSLLRLPSPLTHTKNGRFSFTLSERCFQWRLRVWDGALRGPKLRGKRVFIRWAVYGKNGAGTGGTFSFVTDRPFIIVGRKGGMSIYNTSVVETQVAATCDAHGRSYM